MKTYIVFFRAINVGGKNSLPMKDLVPVLEKAGCKKVKTYIQSGNVVLECPRIPGAYITDAILSRFGFSPDIVVLERSELKAAIRNNPYNSGEGKCVHFYFTAGKFKPDMEKLSRFTSRSEQYEIRGNVFYLHAPEGIGRSKLVSNIDKCLGVTVTGRNLNTVTKLMDLSDQ